LHQEFNSDAEGFISSGSAYNTKFIENAGCFRDNLPYFERMFLRLNYIDITKNVGYGNNGKRSFKE
jgi:hypothetical protein